MKISAIKDFLKKSVRRKRSPEKPFKTLEDQIEAESHGWYDKHWALHRVMHGKKLDEIARLGGRLVIAGIEDLDEKKPAEFYACEEAFAMLEYLIFNAPKVMDSLLSMRINSLKGQLATARTKAEKVLSATR